MARIWAVLHTHTLFTSSLSVTVLSVVCTLWCPLPSVTHAVTICSCAYITETASSATSRMIAMTLVCMCVVVTEPLVAQFRSWLLWMASSSTLIGEIHNLLDMSISNLILTYLFGAAVTPPTKIAFFRYVLSICDKTIWDFENTSIDNQWKSRHGRY